MRRIIGLVAVTLVIASVALALHSTSDAVLLTGANHWAHTALPARVGILINAAANAQDVADGAAAWDSATLSYGVVGTASGSDCDQSGNGRKGYVTVCVGVAGPSGSGTYTYLRNDCWFGANPCDPGHIIAATIYSSSQSPGTYIFCHELGHAIGQAHSGSGCMTPGASAACPSSTDLAESQQNYNHLDSYDSAASFAAFSVTGHANCGGPTAAPTPTPTGTPGPTPAPTPSPSFCVRHPTHWKCR